LDLPPGGRGGCQRHDIFAVIQQSVLLFGAKELFADDGSTTCYLGIESKTGPLTR
jgi:hypothetical protein